jgi:hypothetical protein
MVHEYKDKKMKGKTKNTMQTEQLAIVLSVLLRCMNSDYPFGIFKLFSLREEVLDP